MGEPIVPGMLVTTVKGRSRNYPTPVYRVRWVRQSYWGATVARLESIRNANHTMMAVEFLTPIAWVPTVEEAQWLQLRLGRVKSSATVQPL